MLALRQSSRTTPAFAPLLGSSHGAPAPLRRPRIKEDVFPAKAGTQQNNVNLDPGLRRDDSSNGRAGSQ